MRHSSAQTSLPISTRLDPPTARSHPEREPASATLDELLTADQVAALLLLPVSTVKDYARRGVLPSMKLGKHRRFVRSAVQAALDELARSPSR
jgi:excisionase family DNA binding protein